MYFHIAVRPRKIAVPSSTTLSNLADAAARNGRASIARLESRGLIEALEAEDRRNPYQLTAVGEKALRARLASMQAVAKVGQRRLANA